MVTGQQFGNEAHVDRTARVRVIEQRAVADRDSERLSELNQFADAVSLDGIVKQDNQFGFGRQGFTKFRKRIEFGARNLADRFCGVLIFADRRRRYDVDMSVVMALVGTDLEGEKGLLHRKVRAEDQECFPVVQILCVDERAPLSIESFSAERVDEGHYIARAMVIDIVRPQALAGELLKVKVLFVRGVIRSNDSELSSASFDLTEFLGNSRQSL